MTRAIQYLGLLVSSTLALAAMTAPGAWAGDRYGPAGGGGDDYVSTDYGYSSSADRDRAGYERHEAYAGTYADGRAEDVEEVDPCAMQHHLTGRGCRGAGEGSYRGAAIERDRFGRRSNEVEAIDPCTVQHRLTGRECQENGWDSHGAARTYERRFSARRDDIEDVDPCALQEHLTSHGCDTERFDADRGGRVYRDESAWRMERGYEAAGERYDRLGDSGGYVDACEIVHERAGERCPYARHDRVVRPIWVEEHLPDSFFISEGGVGGGIVDFGGGGGGGGFAFAEGSANANANASASASASARVSVSIMAHNRHMMMHQPKMMHGCGCKKGGY